jgi:hypothetical protein
MGLQIVQEVETQYKPLFLKILEDIQGGVTLRTSNLPSDCKEVLAGAILQADTTSLGLYNVVKEARVATAANSGTSYAIRRPHLFKVGDFATFQGMTAAQVATLLSITHTLPQTDTLVFSVVMGTVTTLTVLYSTATAAATATKYAPQFILRDTVQIHDFGAAVTTLQNVTAGACVRCTIRESASPYFYRATNKTLLAARGIFFL